MQCPCGGNVKETSWQIITERGLQLRELESMSLPVKAYSARCEACGRAEYKYEDSDGQMVLRP